MGGCPLGEVRTKGQVIAGRYRLTERLGEGGMGVVWRAACVEGGADVAIKLVKALSATPSLVRRVTREARAAAAVVHPNVVRLHEVVSVDGAPAIVMELCVGETLAARLDRGGAMAPTEAAPVLLRIAGAVGAAHARGIVHRDLKPANVFLVGSTGGDDVRVLDFGLAKWTRMESGSADTAATASGAFLGTPAWMSPEQAFGERDIDHRTDLWALGIIAYQCLSGVLPTRAANLGQVLKIVLQSKILPLRRVAPDVPVDLAELVDALLRPERGDRPADMRDVVEVLEKHTAARVPLFSGPDTSRPIEDRDEDEDDPSPGTGDVETLDPSTPPSRRPSAPSSPANTASRRAGRGRLAAVVFPVAGIAAIAAVLGFSSSGGGPAAATAEGSEPSKAPGLELAAPAKSAVVVDVAAPAKSAVVVDVAVAPERAEVGQGAAVVATTRTAPPSSPAGSNTSATARPGGPPRSAAAPARVAPAAPAPPAAATTRGPDTTIAAPRADTLWPTEFGP